MNSIDLKQLIKTVDNSLRIFAIDFDKYVKPIGRLFLFDTHNTNEFTSAYVAKKSIEKYLTSNQGCRIAVRELPISYFYKSHIIDNAKKDAEDIKKHGKHFRNEGYFSVDSYFNVDINVSSYDAPINGTHIEHLFVEYKSSKVFEYLLLADDFIKYKIYTYNHEDDTCFVFLNFEKKEMYPTILKKGNPDYILLPKVINKSLFASDDHVFIYIPRKSCNLSANTISVLENTKKLNRLIGEIEKTIIGIDEQDINDRKHVDLNNDFFVNNIGAFKNGVSTAEILLKSYVSFIQPLYEKLKVKIQNTDFNETILKFIKEDFHRYERDLYGNKRNRSLKDGLTTGYKSSLNILVLFNCLNIKNKLGINVSLKSFMSDEANGETKIDYNDILNKNSELLLSYASENDYIYDLAVNVLLFIHSLYERILNFNSDGSYEFKKEYLLIKKTNKLQKLIDEITNILGFRKTIDIFGEHIEEDGKQFFIQAYNKLNGDDRYIE